MFEFSGSFAFEGKSQNPSADFADYTDFSSNHSGEQEDRKDTFQDSLQVTAA
jgi:hypothetical protein